MAVLVPLTGFTGCQYLFHLHNLVRLQMQGSGQGWGNASELNFCVGVHYIPKMHLT